MFYLRSLIEFGQIHNWDYLYTSEFKKWFLNSLVYHPYNLNSFKDKGQIMKFLFNFVFFGVLFYLIWMFFPDTFTMLVNFANHATAFLKDLIMPLWNKVQHQTITAPAVLFNF